MKTILIVILLSLGTIFSDATTVCVRSGGSGSGTDWSSPLANLPTTLVRGNTYYLASGSYTSPALNSVSGTSLVTIKKATVGDHGVAAGWNDSYASGAATFTGVFAVNLGYIIVDGATGGGPGSWTSGFGIVIKTPTGINPVVPIDGGVSNVTFRHCELIGSDTYDGGGGSIANDGFNLGCWGGSPHAFNSLDTITISYCSIHNTGRCPFLLGSDNTTIEYCWTGTFHSSSEQHAETQSIKNPGTGVHDETVRYSVFTHIESTGGLAIDNNGYSNGNWQIYGNVFYLDETSENDANGVIFTWTGYKANTVKVYNNTFINVPNAPYGYLMGFFGRTSDSGGVEFKNNLIYDSSTALSGVDISDYNHWVSVSGGNQGEAHSTTATGNLFRNFPVYDFTLIANTQSGLDLGSPYNVDALGKTRSTWTRGAYEFGGGSPTPTPTPTATPSPSPTPTPPPDGLTIEAESGSISAPFVVSGGHISQPSTTDLTNGGRAVYNFVLADEGDFQIVALVNAPSLTENSFYLNIDGEPQDPEMTWDILPPSVGYEDRQLSWLGNGTADADEIVPKVFHLTAGTHQLILRGREGNTQLDRFTISSYVFPPENVRIIP